MTEAQIGLLYRMASTIPRMENNGTQILLKSYYLMRCKELTRGYGLPEKHFSYKARCPYCCLEWTKETVTKVKPVKLSKRQRKRIRCCKVSKNRKAVSVESRKGLLHSNEIEQICKFCKHSTITPTLKPKKITKEIKVLDGNMDAKLAETKTNNSKKTKPNDTKTEIKITTITNVYSNAYDVFSLKNQNNTITSAIKEPLKVIKNNKRKKDKFAGLCQKAVLASVKMKKDAEKQNKLNLFLKPSS